MGCGYYGLVLNRILKTLPVFLHIGPLAVIVFFWQHFVNWYLSKIPALGVDLYLSATYVAYHLKKINFQFNSFKDFWFAGGITGHVHVSCNCRGLIKHQLIFHCKDGVIILENKNAVVDNFIIETYDQTGVKKLRVNKDRDRRGEDERVKIVRKLATKFVNSCIEDRQMRPSFIEGLRVQELIERIRLETI